MKLLIVLLLFSSLALAQIEFKGNIKGTAKPCSLLVQQVYYMNNIETAENLRADVMVSLEDDDQHISREQDFFFTIKAAGRPSLFSGVASNQKDQLNVMSTAGSVGLAALDFYAIKWWHLNHFHSAQCVNLKRV